MGHPVVFPSKTPESISTSSASFLPVVMALCPGRRRANSDCMKSRSTEMPAGIPSITPPTAAPWLSPKEVTVKSLPNVFTVMLCVVCYVLVASASASTTSSFTRVTASRAFAIAMTASATATAATSARETVYHLYDFFVSSITTLGYRALEL